VPRETSGVTQAHGMQPGAEADLFGGDDSPIRVLCVDDDEIMCELATRIFAGPRYEIATSPDGVAALQHVAENEVDVALVDLVMPRMSGMETLASLKRDAPDVAVIMMTGSGDVDTAVIAMKQGAFHFFTKPFASTAAVATMVDRASDHRRLIVHTRALQDRLRAHERFGELIGKSSAMSAVYRMIDQAAPATSTVLVLGESGTGKELVAHAIHAGSARARMPLVVVNCGAIPKDLVEAELFGHVRGAFSGAHQGRSGLFESAHGGTILLDEIADLPLAAQVKLLRTLQNGEVRRVGSNDTRTVDVRVVAATNVDLAARVEEGTFRSDLYYRLNVIPITLPPLRERGKDVVLLANHFLAKLGRAMDRPAKQLGAEASRAIASYPWPGNVRELEHAMERACVLSPRDVIEPWDLPFGRTLTTAAKQAAATCGGTPEDDGELQGVEFPASVLALPYSAAKREAEALFNDAYLAKLLDQAGGNRSLAARRAGMDKANLRRILRRTRPH